MQFFTENISNWHRNRQTEFSNFQKFYAFLLVLKFRQTSCIGMFLRVNKEIFGCPVVFYEEIIALLWMEMPQIDTEIDKNLKSSNC